MIRKKNQLALLSLSLLSSISFVVQAEPASQHVFVVPHCLLKNVNANYQTLSTDNSLSLISTNAAGIEQLIAAKTQRTAVPCGGFMDVTRAWSEFSAKNIASANSSKTFLAQYAMPANKTLAPKKYKIRYKAKVNQALKQINPDTLWGSLTTLTGFADRYANSKNGKDAAAWFKTQIETIAKNAGHDDVSTYYVKTGSYQQPSVVVKMGTSTEPGIVIGAHMDTLSSYFEKKPGADDDGSGSTTLLEVARTLLNSGMHFAKPIYFVWYAAEEEGLVGSSYVVPDFQAKKIPVDAVMQLDMTGYAHNNESTMWLINDYVNSDLTAFLETLIKTYVKKPVQYTKCGYACSDHATWHQAGIKASFPFEASFGNDDPYIHTAQDTMEKLSVKHMTDYVKLGVAFAVELAEPTA